MSLNQRDRREMNENMPRAIADIIMGFIYGGVGIYFFTTIDTNDDKSLLPYQVYYGFFVICMLYSLMRLWKGVKKLIIDKGNRYE